MGFTKLDSGIVDPSIWSEPPTTRVVWIAFLAKADSSGFVATSYSGMERAANVGPGPFAEAIKCLESPDHDSRSADHDGRRIERVEGGWKILNYEKYRRFSYSGSKEAEKKRRYRERRGQKGDMSTLSTGHSASASVLEINKKKESKGVVKINLNRDTWAWEGIAEHDISAWREIAPACNIAFELKKMIEWVKGAGARGIKKNWRAFIVRWITSAQDKGGTRGFEPADDFDRRQYEAIHGRKQ